MIYLTTIPFEGFYNSNPDAELDNCLERMFSDHETGCEVNHDLVNAAFDNCNWQAVFIEYAKFYTEQFAKQLKINISFESLESPREYNFTTDRIFVNIEGCEVLRLYALVDFIELDKVARAMFTSRSGFHSFYDSDYKTWGPVLEWDCNQLGALIAALCDKSDLEYLMEDAQCNGYMDEWMASNIQNFERLERIHGYLQLRAARAEAVHL